MSKRSRARKRALLAFKSNGNVPGGYIGAMHRGANGQATPADFDFLTRMRNEAKGKDGYTGMDKSKSSFSGTDDSRFTFYQKKDEAVFHCAEANEITTKCPLNPAVPSILIPITMWECFLACCKEYDTEWIALLIGKLDKDSQGKPAYKIDKFYFPPQTASGAHVDVPTGVKPRPGTIGAIHSHVNMGVFWSGTDTAHSNWPVEIVINRREQYESLSRYQLKCGEWAKGKSEVLLTGSYVGKAIDSQVKAAFIAGEALDKANRKEMVGKASVYSPPVSSPAIMTSQTHPTLFSSPSCKACNHYSHKAGEKCPALDCKCDASTFRGETEVCPVTLCTRPEGHQGYHRTEAGDYFQYKAEEPKKEPSSQQSLLPLTVQTDDPTIGELPAEEYCQKCEGYSCVEEMVDGKPIVKDCPDCKGTGLSEIGRLRAAESMLN